jgi:N-acetylmuramoyl-L-alanine amidase
MARLSILEPPIVKVEQKAVQITDPVERLRYLRQEMRPRPPKQKPDKSLIRAGSMITAAVVLIGLVPLPTGTAETLAKERRLVIPQKPVAQVDPSVPHVWLVEKSDALEVYSNGLRVDLTFAVNNRPRRAYPVFSPSGGVKQGEGSAPIGIVYHTTESNLVPFEEGENRRLRLIGRSLIEVVRHGRSYHYLIDRFGRVYRVVQESDAANHSGTSIWGDPRGVYVNLNDSFFGVSFEGQTDAIGEVTPAQIDSGRMLTEMLRSRYSIASDDCVTHAQVSVNPQNMRIGEHIDWAGKFPFAGMGLPDNYSLPLASMIVFGFYYDSVFLRVTGGRWPGLDAADMRVARDAAMEGMETRRYRAILQHRYKEVETALREQSEEVKQ